MKTINKNEMKTPLKSEPLRFGQQWCSYYKTQYLCRFVSRPFSNSNWTRKLKKFKMENENGKTVQSEPLRSISDILQSAVYWCCPYCPLQLSCLVQGFNSISQNRKDIFFIVLRQARAWSQTRSGLFCFTYASRPRRKWHLNCKDKA